MIFHNFILDSNGCAPSNPCMNGGQCTPDGGSFDCACLDGWVGETCETCDPACEYNLDLQKKIVVGSLIVLGKHFN